MYSCHFFIMVAESIGGGGAGSCFATAVVSTTGGVLSVLAVLSEALLQDASINAAAVQMNKMYFFIAIKFQ
jgi:hypothetical protein